MSFFRERPVKSCRKECSCYWCGIHIMPGESKVQTSAIWEGDFQTNDFHPECNDARNTWNADKSNNPDEGWPEFGSMERGKSK